MTGRGVISGALALIALQAIVGSDEAAGRVGGMLAGVARLVRRGLDPAVPAIPDLRAGSGNYDPDGDGPMGELKRPLNPDLGINPRTGQPRRAPAGPDADGTIPGTEQHALAGGGGSVEQALAALAGRPWLSSPTAYGLPGSPASPASQAGMQAPILIRIGGR